MAKEKKTKEIQKSEVQKKAGSDLRGKLIVSIASQALNFGGDISNISRRVVLLADEIMTKINQKGA